MYAIYKELHPPTGIEHCLYCHFYNFKQRNLVLAGANQLHVYRLISQASNAEIGEHAEKFKVECLATFPLFGRVEALEKVTLAGSARDSLLLCFKDAKLSVVEYDPATNGLKTLSLHFFEEDEFRDGIGCNYNLPVLRVDPDARCAVMMIYGTRLVVFPFRKEGMVDDVDWQQRSAILPSYTVDLRMLDEKIINVIDVQFLHGYYEPTLFIIYEPLPTWSGRVGIRQDTCCIVAISLNMLEKVHPIIWSINNLPYDCLRAFPVDKPIGGVLVFAANSLLYLNQSFPPYGISLNSFTEGSTAFPLKKQPGVKITLDCAQAVFVSNERLVISLNGGELYVLTLLVDGMRSVRSFHFDKAASSVLTTCMCTCEEGYIFLGSRLGNSLLLKYTEKMHEESGGGKSGQKRTEPPAKKKRLDTMGDWMASDVADIEDAEELEVYGSTESQAGISIANYTFEVCDSILNIGPCGSVAMGEPAFLSEEFQKGTDPDLELVSTSGHGKNGAISILQRTIRPQVVTTFELPGCRDMWTVVGSPKTKEGEKADMSLDNSHAFLILSRENSSMILQTGQEINELDHSGFSTASTTILASNVGQNAYIVQVLLNSVRLLNGVDVIQEVDLDLQSPVVHASLCDPYLVILSKNGEIALLIFRPDCVGLNAKLLLVTPSVEVMPRIVTLCAYTDESGLFTTQTDTDLAKSSANIEGSHQTRTSSIPQTTDDEDEMLYGESSAFDLDKEASIEPEMDKVEDETIVPTHWIVLCRQNGNLEICSLPDFKVVFVAKNFSTGPRVLKACEDRETRNEGSSHAEISHVQVQEILLVGLGQKRGRPHLFTRIGEELLIYEVFSYHGAEREDSLKLRFSKLPLNLLVKERKEKKKKSEGENVDLLSGANHRLRYFDDIAGYSGIFVSGYYPHWLFMTSRGVLRAHPMGIDGGVTCFAPFHNMNCPKGFLYFNRNGELRIAVLPTHLSYDSPWPVRKVPLRCTPHFVAYHLESKTHGVVTSVPEPCNKIVKIIAEEKHFEEFEGDEGFIYSTIDKFLLQLFSPVSWEPIPNTKVEFDEWEHVTCLKNVSLKSETTVSGLKGYLAVGTSSCYGDEIQSKGKIMLLDVIEVVPEPGQPLTKNKIKIIYDEEQKGPVTALTHVNGHLLGAIGQKIFMWELSDKNLVARAFIDTQMYIHQAFGLKNFVLVADVAKSISLLRFQEETKTLSLVSRDIKPVQVYAAEYFVNNKQIGFLATDSLCNLFLYMYQPEARESVGGQRLIRRADFNIGSRINCMFRVRCKLQDPSTQKTFGSSAENKHVTYFASLDGSLGYLLPITEKIYRRFSMLQNVFVVNTPHNAGLNPRAYRMAKSQKRLLQNQQRNVLDGELLWKFLHLSISEREELTRKIGTSSEQIIEDLLEIDRFAAHF